MSDSIEDVVLSELERAINDGASKPAPKSKPEPVEDDFNEEKEVKKTSKQKLFSKVFGVAPLGSTDHLVTCYNKKDWSKEMQVLIPKLKDNYVWQVAELELLVVGIEINDNIWISGPTGSGKSTLIEQFCAATKRPFIRYRS